ncbi:MAG: membrane dipeptidase, partial [Pseudomonadota bacterium]
MSSKTIPIPTVRVGGAIGPLPRGLTGWIARIADRASNRADRSNLPFDGEIDALFYRRAALPAPVGERAAAEASEARAEPPQDEPGLLIADLHSDTLLWGVDPLAARSGGHMDLPRLIAARSGLQVFGGPTWTPLPMRNSEQALCVSCESIDQSDALFPSQLLERARRGKAASRRKRAYKLAERFHQMLHRDGGRATQAIYRPEDLQGLWRGLGAPGPKNGRIGMMLSLEGLHWLEPDEDPAAVRAEIAALRAAGFRMIAPTHRFSNGMGGASEDCQGRMGLTRAGHAAFSACFESGVAVDLAHASPALIRDVAGLALTHGSRPLPVIVSHAGVRATKRQPRNLPDA